MTPLE
jgi:hypothetical protein